MFQSFRNKITLTRLFKAIKDCYPNSSILHHEYPPITINNERYYSYRLCLTTKNDKIYAWGSSNDKDEAILKSLMELIERIEVSNYYPILFKNKKKKDFFYFQIESDLLPTQWLSMTTSGCAIHFKENKAKDNALKELLERHIVLYSIANDIGPKFLSSFNLSNINIELWEWKTEKLSVVCSRIKSKVYEGFYYYLGTAKNTKKAITKSILEATPLIITLQSCKEEVLDKSKVNERIKKDASIKNIQDYHLFTNIDANARFFNKNNPQKEILLPPDSKLFFHKYDTFLSRELSCIRYISPLTQPLFFGNWSEKYTNSKVITGSLPGWPPFIN